MTKKYSIAEARKQLPSLINEVEGGQHVEITRRGRPVAIVIPLEEYKRISSEPDSFSMAYSAWRQTVDQADLEWPDGFYDELRDRSGGREVKL
ncbi:MAG: type II toxin-antitoxin system Phd/YefM family antitoxin [Proteobacteria bacterium]|jgi:antitoxin Phd|nr:type II toxin-antitoxin system Phd/YefM family antitoxin [Pseudomonadota bacterium]